VKAENAVKVNSPFRTIPVGFNADGEIAYTREENNVQVM
jgi:hypothetical protein